MYGAEVDRLKCKSCRRAIPENAIFCPWCGRRQVAEANEIRVPAPRRLPSGTWRGQMMVAGRRVSVTAPTEKEYYVKARATRAGLLDAAAPDNRIVADVVTEYIAQRDGTLSPATIDGYLRKARQNLQELMPLRLRDLTTARVQKAVDQDRGRYSGKTIWEAVSLLQSATGLRFEGLVLPSKRPKKTPPVYTSDDLRALLRGLAEYGGQVEAAGLLAVWMSLRRSEIMGLRWEDLLPGALRIRAARVYDKSHRLVVKETKNQTSERTIPCDSYIMDRLLALPREDGQEYVFSISTSGIWEGITAVCDRAGIPHGYLHGLRHTNASIMELLGVPPMYSNKRGGWANDHIRTGTYTDAMPEGDRAAADLVDGYMLRLLGRPEDGAAGGGSDAAAPAPAADKPGI